MENTKWEDKNTGRWDKIEQNDTKWRNIRHTYFEYGKMDKYGLNEQNTSQA